VTWFDGDAYPDVASTDGVHAEVRVLLGAADGSFTLLAPHTFGVPADPSGLIAGFFDFDSFADLVVIGRGGAHNVLLGNGDGTFTTLYAGLGGILTGVPASSLVAADVNGDFFTDVVFGTPDGRVAVAAGTGGGSFLNGGVFMLASMSPVRSVAVGDVDFDGDLDFIALQEDTTLTVFAGGTLTLLGVPLLIGGTPRSIVAGRFDQSPGDDVAVLDGAHQQVRFFSGGLAPFSPPFDTVPLDLGGLNIVVEPRPNDMLDAIVVTTLDDLSPQGALLHLTGDPATSLWGSTPIQGAPALPLALAVADMNLDSALDLVVSSGDVELPIVQGFVQTFVATGR
jgi:hypothetical protein